MSQRLAQWAGFFLILTIALYGVDRLLLFARAPQTGVYGVFRSGGYAIQTVADARSIPPLESGQRIIAVDGIPVSAWFQSLFRIAPRPGPSWSLDRPVAITVTDQKGVSRAAILSLRSFSANDLWGPFRIWFLAWFIFFSGTYFFFRYPDQLRVRLLSLLLLVAALSVFNHSGRHLAIEMNPRLPLLITVRFGALSFIFSSWLHLIIIFLNIREHLRIRSWVPWAIYFLPPASALGAAFFSGGDTLFAYERSLRLLHLTAGIVVALTFTILLHSFYTTRDALLKAQLKWLIWGHLLGMSPYILLYSLPIALTGAPLISYGFSLAPLPLIVFSYFFAFYRYRVMDVDRVLEGSLVYGVSAALLSLVYLAVLWLVKEKFLGEMAMGSWFRPDFLILIGLAFGFNPLKNQIQRGIEKALFPERIALPALLLEESDQLSRSFNLNDLAAVLLGSLPQKLAIDQAALYLRRPFSEDWELRTNPGRWLAATPQVIPSLERLAKREPLKTFWDIISSEENPPAPEKAVDFLKKSGVAYVFPFMSGDELWGFYLLGGKRTNRLLNSEEVHVIRTLATQAAHQVGNARLLEGLQQTNLSLSEVTSRLMQAEQLANLGEGSAVLAHELKNPLGIIRGSAEILLKNQDPSSNAEVLHFILAETDRLTALVDEFMQFARIAPPQKTDTDLNALIQSVAFLWESRRKSPVPLTVRFQLDLQADKVPLDSRQVYQVLLNLFSNAEAAMPGGGELLLATGQDQASGMAWASVQDTGKGIPEKDLPRVFDRFFTTKESGLGLGLALAKKVMEAHGGSIRVKSSEGEGTRVTLFFPRQEDVGQSLPISDSVSKRQ